MSVDVDRGFDRDDFPRVTARTQLEFELDFFAAILARDPCHAPALKAHAANLAASGQVAKALQADRRLVRLQPDRPVPWYNLACSYALLGMTDLAFAALHQALDHGYYRLDHLARDPDLKSLRRDPRFGRLLRKVLSAD